MSVGASLLSSCGFLVLSISTTLRTVSPLLLSYLGDQGDLGQLGELGELGDLGGELGDLMRLLVKLGISTLGLVSPKDLLSHLVSVRSDECHPLSWAA